MDRRDSGTLTASGRLNKAANYPVEKMLMSNIALDPEGVAQNGEFQDPSIRWLRSHANWACQQLLWHCDRPLATWQLRGQFAAGADRHDQFRRSNDRKARIE
jgi:hypothetical protein